MKQLLVKIGYDYYIVDDRPLTREGYYYNRLDHAIRVGRKDKYNYHHRVTHSNRHLKGVTHLPTEMFEIILSAIGAKPSENNYWSVSITEDGKLVMPKQT